MTDHDPLAAIERLADDLGGHATDFHRGTEFRLRAALTEARQAVDALVAERDAAREALARVVAVCDKAEAWYAPTRPAGWIGEVRAALAPTATDCTGAADCRSGVHEHGCFADIDGTACDDPSDHPATDEEAGQ